MRMAHLCGKDLFKELRNGNDARVGVMIDDPTDATEYTDATTTH